MKKEYILNGLGCAVCAGKIENAVKEIDGVHSASVDFSSAKLKMDIDRYKQESVKKQVIKIATGIESEIKVSEVGGKEDKETGKLKFALLFISALLFSIGMIFNFTAQYEFLIFFLSYLITGYKVLYKAVRNIFKGQVFDENFLMGIASAGAFLTGNFSEGAAVMIFYEVGEMLQSRAVDRSRKSIASLVKIRPEYANLLTDGEETEVSPEDVNIGQTIIIRPGEKVPLDCKIISGSSFLDTSVLTGESVPKEVGIGDEILSGSVNQNGVLTAEVTKTFSESAVSKILNLVENAADKKSKTENFITKFARYYTPAVVFTAAALAVLPPLFIGGAQFADYIHRALIFLVISCPCALVISIPLGFFGGIGCASKNGILIKGSNYLDALNSVDTVVFDKTGTLTKGTFNVTETNAVNGDADELLKLAAYAESYSSHPIAMSVTKAFGKEIDKTRISNYNETPGCGIAAEVDGKKILAGNKKLMDMHNISIDESHNGTVLNIAADSKFEGYIKIDDELKNDSKVAVSSLKKSGIKTVMLTGDNKNAASQIAKQLDLDEYYSELLPDEKVSKLETLTDRHKVMFVGDGINDAPVLARADVGAAMGGVGSDAAIEAADIVLMSDEPSKITTAFKIARNTKKIVIQNIVFALGIKAVFLILGAFGLATMWEAVFADVGVTVIAVLNSVRTMKVKL